MRIFVLSTGRCGSFALANACQLITNYSVAHESLTTKLGRERFDYPDQHIEIDNRLSWHLGTLAHTFPKNTYFVHLRRDPEKVASSYAKRFHLPGGIMDAFVDGIRMTPSPHLAPAQQMQASRDLVKTINDNISEFLKDKSNSITIEIENIKTDFPIFWKQINAEGDLDAALAVFDSSWDDVDSRQLDFVNRMKLVMKNEWRHLQQWLRK